MLSPLVLTSSLVIFLSPVLILVFAPHFYFNIRSPFSLLDLSSSQMLNLETLQMAKLIFQLD